MNGGFVGVIWTIACGYDLIPVCSPLPCNNAMWHWRASNPKENSACDLVTDYTTKLDC
jgi:hypothetical protein